jgi:Transposase domain (DUF772)
MNTKLEAGKEATRAVQEYVRQALEVMQGHDVKVNGSRLLLRPIHYRAALLSAAAQLTAAAALIETKKWRHGRIMTKRGCSLIWDGLSDQVHTFTSYYQYLCGEEFFQHRARFDRSSITRWRQRMGEERLAALLLEALRVLHVRLNQGAFVRRNVRIAGPTRATSWLSGAQDPVRTNRT